ncbi:VOC family protein [Ornithinibacter aureus]|uniref:VOC family protein n=1 Tax=Ornithinibacter aureus TaxID=622664 RepID=A0ABP8J9H5_9MICO|nr:VOC family protein [Ornithinibacter aureus]KAF0832298.1 catechol 2,3-dioxygenase-like lactoylglutathione lyase family enzyme [Ornithinibacter aureus]
MLGDHDSIAVIAVNDLDRARTFYEGVLGLTSPRDVPEGVVYTAGSTVFLVYPSSFAGTNRATAMSFQIAPDEFDAEVQTLRKRGVTFTTFEAEGLAWADGVASYGGFKSAWFEDPDGNVLNVETGV